MRLGGAPLQPRAASSTPARTICSRPTTIAGTAFDRNCSPASELRVVLSGDFLTLAWRKLFLNIVANPFTRADLAAAKRCCRRLFSDVHELTCRAILDELRSRSPGRIGRRVRVAADEAERFVRHARGLFGRARHLDVFRPPGRPHARSRGAHRRRRRRRRAPRSSQPRSTARCSRSSAPSMTRRLRGRAIV